MASELVDAATGSWLIACAGAQLGRRPHAVTVRGEPLVLWRDRDGRAQAVADRCCHRQVPLSMGRIQGGRITCRYHGWCFDGSGRCTAIPSLPVGTPMPAGARVRGFPCVEQDGFCWVWLEMDPPPAGPPPLPEMAMGRWLLGIEPMACPWQAAVENMLDASHVVVTHRWTHPAWFVHLWHGWREGSVVVRPTPAGFEVMNAKDEPPSGERPRMVLRYDHPGRITLTAAIGRRRWMHILLVVVPTAPGHCQIAWAMTRWLPLGPRYRFARREPAVFRQDRELLEAQARAGGQPGAEVHVPADRPALRVRAWMRASPGQRPSGADERLEIPVRH